MCCSKHSAYAMFFLVPAFMLLIGFGCAKTDQLDADSKSTGSELAIEQEERTSAEDSLPTKVESEKELLTEEEVDEKGKHDLATMLRKEQEEFEKQSIEIPSTWKRMSKESHVWADKKNRQVIVRGAICIEEGLLEMFACPQQTKEHESVISVHAKAYEAHATLVALGIKPGKPMRWMEEYSPVSGPVIDIEVWWTDDSGKLVKRRAQDMIMNTETEKPMECDFVFGGGELYHDPASNSNSYSADFGPMINVANQPDAMIDVAIQSSDAAQGSLFAAMSKNIPPVNTKVYLVLSDSGRMANVDQADLEKPKATEIEQKDSSGEK